MLHREAHSEADSEPNCKKAVLERSECDLAKYDLSPFSIFFVSGEVIFGRPGGPPQPQAPGPSRLPGALAQRGGGAGILSKGGFQAPYGGNEVFDP